VDAVRGARDPVALLVDGPVVAAAEQRQVVEPRRAPVRPVVEVRASGRRGAGAPPPGAREPEVVALGVADRARREAAAAVPRLERPPERGRDGAGPPPHVEDPAVARVAHHDPRRITRQTARRFS
jgi:hypothetical protein